MSEPERRSGREDWWTTPVVRSLKGLNREKAAYVALALVALALRLWGLGARALSFDECQHLYFSWQPFSVGSIYQFDPLSGPITHGPFLFLATTLMYAVFGVSDFASRLPPAFFGTVLVVMPYFVRKWLGRTGALAASAMLTVSPFLLFYSRDNLHEIYGGVFAMAMAIALLRFLEERKARDLYIFGGAAGLYLCTKAVAFIMGFIVVAFVLIGLLWERLPEKASRWVRGAGIAASGLAVVLAFWLTQRPQPGGASRGAALPIFVMLVCLVAASVLAGWAWRQDEGRRPLATALSAIRWRALAGMLGAALVVIVVLYTSLFTNARGLTGPLNMLSYWLGQHGEGRGGQPWYYFLMLLSMYEFLPFLGGAAAIIYYAFVHRKRSSDRDSLPVVPFLVFWAITALAIHSWTGEKMPQHTVYMVLPMILLSGRLVQDWIGDVDWTAPRHRAGLAFAALLPVAGYTLSRLLSGKPFAGVSLPQLSQTMAWLAALVIGLGLALALLRVGRRLGRRLALQACAASIFAILLILTLRFSWMASFVNYDTAEELLVYAHGTQDAKVTLREIVDISSKTVGDTLIKIAYDAKTGLPFTNWYLRDFPNASSFSGESPTREALDAPIVIVHTWNEGKVKPFLANKYDRFPRRLMWWPAEDYKDLTPARAFAAIRDPVKRSDIWNILWHRKYKYALNSWPYREEYAVYIRKDVTAQLWQYSPLAGPSAAEDEYLKKLSLVPSLFQIGGQGQAAGQLNEARGVAADAAGNIYVADTNNHRIQVFDASGKLLRQWGEFGSGPGQFNEPWGIAVGADGSVFVADTWNHRVQKFDADGGFVTMWGTNGDSGGLADSLPGQFYGPRAVAVAPDGTVLVVDTGNKRIQRFTPAGQFVEAYGGYGAGDGQFWEPVGLAVDKDGYVYVADTWNQRIQKFDREFRFVSKWAVQAWPGQSVVNKPYLAVDGQGNLFASDPEGHRLLRFSSEGVFIASVGEFGVDASRFNLPVGLAVDAQDRLLVADSANHRIMVFPPMEK